MVRVGTLLLMLCLSQGRPATGKVNSSFDKTADFKAFQTYGWTAGQHAFDPSVHKTIVDAIDAELAAIGLKKVEGQGGNVTVRYLAVRSSSVNLDKLEALQKQGANQEGATVTVGRLIIVMEDAKSGRRLWAADSVERLDPAAGERDAVIKGVVVRMFETYPTRLKK